MIDWVWIYLHGNWMCFDTGHIFKSYQNTLSKIVRYCISSSYRTNFPTILSHHFWRLYLLTTFVQCTWKVHWNKWNQFCQKSILLQCTCTCLYNVVWNGLKQIHVPQSSSLMFTFNKISFIVCRMYPKYLSSSSSSSFAKTSYSFCKCCKEAWSLLKCCRHDVVREDIAMSTLSRASCPGMSSNVGTRSHHRCSIKACFNGTLQGNTE